MIYLKPYQHHQSRDSKVSLAQLVCMETTERTAGLDYLRAGLMGHSRTAKLSS